MIMNENVNNFLLARQHTEVLLDMVAEGIFDPLDVLKSALCWMSDDQVRRMAEANEYFPEVEE